MTESSYYIPLTFSVNQGVLDSIHLIVYDQNAAAKITTCCKVVYLQNIIQQSSL